MAAFSPKFFEFLYPFRVASIFSERATRKCDDSFSRIVKRRYLCANSDKTGFNLPIQRLLRVAILGEPNSGKSTLANQIVGNRISAVTPVIHTTRKRTVGVYTVKNTQIIIQDTPGVIPQREGRRLKMSKEHMHSPAEALEESDFITVIHDVSRKRTKYRIHEAIIENLDTYSHIPAILIFNKTDLVKDKSELLKIAFTLMEDRKKDEWGYENTGGWSKFKEVFMISALTKDGLGDVIDYIVSMAKPGDWLYPATAQTDLTIDQRISEVIRENLLLMYEDEIPWQVKQVTVLCEERSDGSLRIHQKLYTRKKSQRRCIMEKLPNFTMRIAVDLEEVLKKPVEFSIDIDVSGKHSFNLPVINY